jgi:hypothetical protein
MQASCDPYHLDHAFADCSNGMAPRRQFDIETHGVAVIRHKEAPHNVNSGK